LRQLNAHKVRYLVVGGYPVPFISYEDLIRNKTASGRDKDRVDVAALQKRTTK